MNEQALPFFSVVVPTCHRNEDLTKCLDCLAPGAQTLNALRYEVIVSDDGSSSSAEGMIREHYPWAKWTQGPRRGPAANRNHGAAMAVGEWLVFVDDDCLPAPGLLEGYARGIADFSDIQVTEGKTVPLGVRQRLDERCPENQTGGKLWSCNFAIKAKLFVSIGGFDDTFPFAAFEDIEFGIRLKKSGVKIAFCERAVVFHPWRKEKGFKFWFNSMDSLVLLIKKHPDQKKYYTLLNNFKILSGSIYQNFLPECIALKGRGLFKEIFTILWIFLLKVYKINLLSKIRM